VTSSAIHIPGKAGFHETAHHFRVRFWRGGKAWTMVADVLFGAAEQLAAGRFVASGNLRDVGIFVVENLPEQKHRPFERGQAFEQHEKRHRNRLPIGNLAQRREQRRAIARDDRLRQPWADVVFALHLRRFQIVDAQMMHDGRQKTLERANRLWRRGAIAQIRLLHDIFRLHRAAQHAVSQGEQQRPVVFKWISLHSVAFRTLGVLSIWR
jgi:hypothetical protein